LLRDEITRNGDEEHQIRIMMDASEGGRSVLINITPRLGFNRWVPPAEEALREAEGRWHRWFVAAPPVAEPYQLQYYHAWWTMRAGLISSRYFTTREVMMPSKIHYVGSWQWDNFFHALAYRHLESRLAQDQLRILVDHQRDDGMIPDAIHDEGTVTRLTYPVEADVTKPPLIAWAAWKLFEIDGDREFLDEIYEPIVRWNNWWFDNNDVDGNGLCEYQHPFSSGLDDSPLWDQGMPVESPDLNTYLCLQQESLAKIAAALGQEKDAVMWIERAESMARRLVDGMWDKEAGMFWAKCRGQRVPVRTPFSLFPLMTGRMPQGIVRRLVDHLTDEESFWSRFPVPTVALDDPCFTPDVMWRGPTWINVNYLLIEGLDRVGRPADARELRKRTLELVAGQPDFYEYYDPRTGAKGPKAASTFGWTAALFIDLAIQASRDLG
jgi:putative isomerase